MKKSTIVFLLLCLSIGFLGDAQGVSSQTSPLKRPGIPFAIHSDDRFTFTPWEMQRFDSGKQSPPTDHAHPAQEAVIRILDGAPHAGDSWQPAPPLSGAGYESPWGDSLLRYAYFRTTLNVPPDVSPASISLIADVDNAARIFVNGQPLRSSSRSLWLPLKPYLHIGRNSVVALVARWQGIGLAFRGVSFLASLPEGEYRIACAYNPAGRVSPLEGGCLDQNPAWKEANDGPDEWLRFRRDAANSAHSTTPLHLPLKERWAMAGPVRAARIWGRTALLHLGERGAGDLVALDLPTGHELWRVPKVDTLGDASEEGTVAISQTLDSPAPPLFPPEKADQTIPTLSLLKVSDGRPLWSRKVEGLGAPMAVHDGILYCLSRLELTRIRLSDAALLPTPPRELEGWGEPAFTKDRVLFGAMHQLYDFDPANPQTDLKFYDGGYVPMLSGSHVTAEGWFWSARTYAIEGAQPGLTWSLRSGRDEAHCLLPLGDSGAVLLHDNPNNGPALLGLYDVATGGLRWGRKSQIASYALSAGKDLVFLDGRWDGNLAVLDAVTGKPLWKSKEYAGTPLAASRGYLLVSQGNRLVCLK